MAKERKSGDTPNSTPKKAAKSSPAKKVTAKKVAAKKPAAAPVAATVAAPSSQLSTLPVRQAQPSASQLHDEVRRRAYELFRQRGGHHGSHEADWHRAELEVRSKYKA
jgi:hypothetical protein